MSIWIGRVEKNKSIAVAKVDVHENATSCQYFTELEAERLYEELKKFLGKK